MRRSILICASIVFHGVADHRRRNTFSFLRVCTKGALYYPDPCGLSESSRRAHDHTSELELSFPFGDSRVSPRGFVALGMNPRCDNNEALCRPRENNALDVKSGVNFPKKLPGITKIILFGHSGGGPTTSFYQAVAENGVVFCQDPRKWAQCADSLAGLPLGRWNCFDGRASRQGPPALRSLNPAVTNDNAVLKSLGRLVSILIWIRGIRRMA